MCKSSVGFSHTMDFVTLLHGAATAFGRVEQFAGETLRHGLFRTLLGRFTEPAHGEGHTADRTDFDLKAHMGHSGESLEYLDPVTNEKYVPYCIEPSLGVDRMVLAFLCNAYEEQELEGGDVRMVLHLHPALAPYKAAILPLSKKLAEPARKIYQDLCSDFMLDYDDTGSIGKRYRREDEIGTPYCITVDFATVGDDKTPADNAVTIRERDSMEQVRVPISELKNWLAEHTKF